MSVLIGTKVKNSELWLPRFITQIEQLEGNINRIVIIYGESRDATFSYLKNWQTTSRHKIEIYQEPYLNESERNGACLTKLKQDIQQLLKEGTEEYYLNLDCDLVKLPKDLIPKLVAQNKDLVAAMVWTEGREQSTFFDIYEFRKDGCMFHPYNPPGLDETEAFTVDSVSTCYLAKREVELAGIYSNPYPHIPFCKSLKDRGFQIWVDPNTHAFHVDLERYGILHNPLPNSPYSNAPFITKDGQKMDGAHVGAERFSLSRKNYDAYLQANEPESLKQVQTFLDKRPLITASIKALNEAEFIKQTLDGIYNAVDKIDIVYGPVAQSSHITYHDETPTILQNYPDPQHKITVIEGEWASKEHIQAKLLERCTSKWMLFIDADEILTPKSAEAMRKFCMEHQDGSAVYARPKRFYNFLHDFKHIAWSLNPMSPWAEYGLPHPFLIWRDVEGLNFSSFHTLPQNGFGEFVHVDNPRYKGKQKILDDVEVYHMGNAKNLERLRDKIAFERRRDGNPSPVKDDWLFTGVMPPEFVVAEFPDELLPEALKKHMYYGLSRIRIVQKQPSFRFEMRT